eukprot:4027290-Prymnesium_polylepis.2
MRACCRGTLLNRCVVRRRLATVPSAGCSPKSRAATRAANAGLAMAERLRCNSGCAERSAPMTVRRYTANAARARSGGPPTQSIWRVRRTPMSSGTGSRDVAVPSIQSISMGMMSPQV